MCLSYLFLFNIYIFSIQYFFNYLLLLSLLVVVFVGLVVVSSICLTGVAIVFKSN